MIFVKILHKYCSNNFLKDFIDAITDINRFIIGVSVCSAFKNRNLFADFQATWHYTVSKRTVDQFRKCRS